MWNKRVAPVLEHGCFSHSSAFIAIHISIVTISNVIL